MVTKPADPVWYVSYGSNLHEPRLQRYLDGGADATPPSDRRAVVLPHALRFAGESRVWTGGVAFIDHTADPGARTLATAWLIDRAQFDALVARETAGGRYDTVVATDPVDGLPAVTFTAGPAAPVLAPAPPAPAYVAAMAAGLRSVHGLTTDDVVGYLADRPGVTGRLGPDDLHAAVSGPVRLPA